MNMLRKLADRLISLSAFIGSAGLIIEMLVILVDVIGRAFGFPLFGSQDLITMTMILIVFGAMALCDRQGGHIAVDLLERKFPAKLNRMIDAVSALMGAVIFVMLALAVYDVVAITVRFNMPDSTNLLNLPMTYFRMALIAFALITAFGMLLRSIELATSSRDVRGERDYML